MNTSKKFNIQILLIALLSYIVIAVVFTLFIPNRFHYSLLIVPALLVSTTYLLHQKLIAYSDKRPQKFITMFMAVTGIKLLLYLFFLLIYILLLTEHAIPFLSIFFILYIIYSFMEAISLLKYLKQQQK